MGHSNRTLVFIKMVRVLLNGCDGDKGIKFLYDSVIRLSVQQPGYFATTGKEITKVVKLWIKRKRASDIVYGDTALDIVPAATASIQHFRIP